MKKEKENINLPVNAPLVISSANSSISWDAWLFKTEVKLKNSGYRKYVQNYKNEDFCYWKIFKKGDEKIYQIGVLFYDFRKYASRDPNANRIGVAYECMLLGNDMINLSVTKDIDLVEFEEMSEVFYEAMLKYCS